MAACRALFIVIVSSSMSFFALSDALLIATSCAAKNDAFVSSIAEKIGSPRSVRAVAGACAANAHAVAIPCHRVVRHDGGLSGYRWGVERKRELIDREQERAA